MAIRLVRFNQDLATPVTAFESIGAHTCDLAHGQGEVHAYVVYFEEGGSIGPHPAGFDQVFVAIKGTGWVAGTDGARYSIEEGCGAFIPAGENHSKGSEYGMVAVMIQASNLKLNQEP